MRNKLKVSEEFVVGKHGIGYVSDAFLKAFKDVEFEPVLFPEHQILQESMNDPKIESTLKPGHCGMGEVLAVIQSDLPIYKDGNFNLFYTPSFVVSVHRLGDEWHVGAWERDGSTWSAGYRVFSPATDQRSDTRDCHHSCSCSFDTRLLELEKFKKDVQGVLKLPDQK